MGKQIKITKEEYEEVKEAIKKNKHKKIDKKLQVIALRYEGMKCSEITIHNLSAQRFDLLL